MELFHACTRTPTSPPSKDSLEVVVLSEEDFANLISDGQILRLEVVSEQMWVEGTLADGRIFRTAKLSGDTLTAVGHLDGSLDFQTVRSQSHCLTIALTLFVIFFVDNYLISSTRKNYALKCSANGSMVDNTIKDSLVDIQSMQTKPISAM